MRHFIVFLLLSTSIISCSKPDNGTSNGGQNSASAEKEIISFKLLGLSATINNTSNKIELTLPSGTDLSNLTPDISVSPKATISPKTGEAQNFSSPVTYIVTAENKTTRSYSATISTSKSTNKKILSFLIDGKTATIDETSKTIQLELPSGTSLTSLAPTITISDKATVNPESGTSVNFTSPVQYTVKAEDGSTAQYTATITTKKSTENSIIAFDLIKANLSNSVYTKTPDTVIGYINQSTKEILFTSQENANIQSVTPLIKISENATVSPNSMKAEDFNIPLKYTVTAENGTTNEYTVKFTKKKFSYSASSFLSLTPYIRPNKTAVKVGEEIMVEITGASYYPLTTRSISWARPASGGGTTVSGTLITKVTSDGSKFYFKFSEAGAYKVWILLEDYIDGATRQVKSNEYDITVQ